MKTMLIILCLFILINLIYICDKKIKTKKLIIWLRNRYGKKPVKNEYNWSKLSYYLDEIEESITEEEKIDDITWDDLEMNDVFSRVNSCNSFVGEQLLYSTLHRLTINNKEREIMENRVNFFSSHENIRTNTQLLICSIGKNDESYYLPMFINNLDMLKYKESGNFESCNYCS